MKNIPILILAILTPAILTAQRHDNWWIFTAPGLDTTGNSPLDPPYPATFINFNTSPPGIAYVDCPFFDNIMKTTMSDGDGSALFHSNGYSVFNMDGTVFLNGDSLNPTPLPAPYPFGPPFQMSMMSIRRPDHENDYYIFHLEAGPDWWERRKLIVSLAKDVTIHNTGSLLYKNKALFDGGHWLEFFQATKHANGRDWWIVFSDADSIAKTRTFYSVFIGPDTMYLANKQTFPNYEPVKPVWENSTWQRKFTPDGRYLVTLDLNNGIRIHPFDRCSGLLGPLFTLPYHRSGLGGLEISPNSRFLYAATSNELFQYDLMESDIASSLDTVALYDGFIDTLSGGAPTHFDWLQSGPDGKIYCTSSYYMHYIAKPNKKGQACSVVQRGLKMPTYAQSPTYYPNYRLGPLDGSPCDTLGLNNEPLADFWWFTDSTLAVEFADNSFYEPAQWYWDFGDGSVSPDTNPVHTFPSAGVYEVCLTVSNPYAADTVCKMVSVGTNAAGQPTTSDEAGLWVFPNPAIDYTDITWDLPSPGRMFTLYDGLGRMVFYRQLTGKTGRLRLDVAHLPTGFYFYRTDAGNGRLSTGKLRVQH